MNIQEAKVQIQNAMKAYFTKDEYGNHIIPIERQRPIFLMGPPGIGKTAIMEQVAAELGVGLVSYSMTHHTRQSALGLPFIEKKMYDGKEYNVSEYTMSEIIASVYDMMEQTGLKEGILFLDEINCVSETLAPSMLQFLQYKIFGRHRVPNGWIVVTAGNPPEFNNSVREFDIVTWDRLKRIDVEADFDTWEKYAIGKGTHASILSYLKIVKGDFYKIESTTDGKSFVTARGWSDLSDMIQLYEMNGITVDENLIGQYLQNRRIAKDFAVYYDLFKKYQSDYQVDKIIAGKATDEIKKRAKNAKWDERLALISLLVEAVSDTMRKVYNQEQLVLNLKSIFPNITRSLKSNRNAVSAIDEQIKAIKIMIEKGKLSSSITSDDMVKHYQTVSALEQLRLICAKSDASDLKSISKLIMQFYGEKVDELQKQIKLAGQQLTNLFQFCEESLSGEIINLETDLTISRYGAHYLASYPCAAYEKHSKDLRFSENHIRLVKEIDRVDFDKLKELDMLES